MNQETFNPASEPLLFEDRSVSSQFNPFIVDSNLCNSHGSLRVGFVRKHYGLISEEIGSYVDKEGNTKVVTVKAQKKPLTRQDIDEIVSLYVVWRDTLEFLPICYTYREITESSNPRFIYEWAIKQTVKRGNGPYIRLVKQKLEPFYQREPLNYFSTELNDNRKRKRYTNLLYVTGTLDPSQFDGLADMWLHFDELWNKFTTNIRQQFGGCEYMRTWQSQEAGRPHFHAVMWLPFDFSMVSWFGEDGRLSWRIHPKQKLHKGDTVTVRQRLKNAWKWGGLDIVGVSDINEAFKDMVKYITRDLEGGESNLSNAMAWYFGKQSYSITKNFEKSVFGTSRIDRREPSNTDLIKPESSNSNYELIRIQIYPIVSGDDLDFSYQSKLDLGYVEPKPPPDYERFLDDFASSCEPVKEYRKDGVEYIIYKRGDFYC